MTAHILMTEDEVKEACADAVRRRLRALGLSVSVEAVGLKTNGRPPEHDRGGFEELTFAASVEVFVRKQP